MKKFLVLFIIANLLFPSIKAYEIKKLSYENGLSNNNIVSIDQDKDGFMWFCSKDGLNRFDGKKFKIFRNDPEDKNSIMSNVLNCVYADENGEIVWIGSEKNGMDAYNYITGEFTHFRPGGENTISADGITHITGDGKGNLWIATYFAGIDFYNTEKKEFTHYNSSNVKGLVSNYNWVVYPDGKDRIITGHVFDGFSIINTRTRTAENYKNIPGNPNSLPDNTVTCILRDSYKNLWIGTRNGLSLVNLEQGTMKNFFVSPHNKESLSLGFVKSLVETPDKKLWIGMEGDGVRVLDLSSFSGFSSPENIHFEHIYESLNSDGLSSSSVQTIYNDSYGNLWIAGYTGGINFISGKENYFNVLHYLPLVGNTNSLSAQAVVAICHDEQGNTWMATVKGGIDIYHKGKKLRNINKLPGSNLPLITSTLSKGSNNTIWIGTNAGNIIKHSPLSNHFKILKSINETWNIPIYHIFEDKKGLLWISTDIGLIEFDLNTENYLIHSTKNSPLHDDNVRWVNEDAEGNIWVGTLGGGLQVFTPQFKMIKDFSPEHPFYVVNQIYRDSKDRMWVSSQNDLLLFHNLDKSTIQRFGIKEGLKENNIKSVVEGNNPDEIWISATNTLSVLNLKTGIIRNFDKTNNIASGDYLPGSSGKSKDGILYFGSQKGISYFNSSQTMPEYGNITSHFTGFRIIDFKKGNLNEFVEIPFSEKQVLKYNQNTIQIDFNTLDYSLNGIVEFMYQMKGLDDEWYYIGNEKQVVFRNLKPGKYEFNLKMRIHNREWTEQLNTMTIRINPPFWFAWYAKLLYILLIIIVAYYIIRFYKDKIDIENRLMYEKKNREQEHELNEEKIRFYTNITHELRTPMTLIIGPLEELIQNQALPDKIAGRIKSIHRIANRLLRLVNQILEFRNSESNIRQLFVRKENLSNHVYEIGLKYKELNRNPEINFILTVPDEPLILYFDPEVITIIVDNLLSNAFKYTAKGEIVLKLEQVQEGEFNYTDIVVTDTGFGISEKDLPKIFDRYYQAKDTEYSVSGTGIGLSLLKNMVELHQAEVKVESRINEGTIFTIRLLSTNNYPEANHFEPVVEEIIEEDPSDESKARVLVIDDNTEIVEYIRECLSENYEVICAYNGKEGFEQACEHIPDIVISDIMMPVMDGIEFCKTMKAEVRTCHIPIILLTAKGSMQDKTEGYEAGADSYLTKPFSATLLRSRIKNILEARRKLSESSTGFSKNKLIFSESINKLDKDFLEKLSFLIGENIEDEELNISKIASQLNMSHSTLYRKIKGITGMTANEFIRKLKMKKAEELLISGKYNINEVMYKVGINSIGYFRQCFREEFGMNPSDYLQKLK